MERTICYFSAVAAHFLRGPARFYWPALLTEGDRAEFCGMLLTYQPWRSDSAETRKVMARMAEPFTPPKRTTAWFGGLHWAMHQTRRKK